MPTNRNNPAVWLRIQWVRTKVFLFSVALRLLFRLMRLLLGRAPTQEELSVVFEQEHVPAVLTIPSSGPDVPTRKPLESPHNPHQP